jgi:hypothetical protein
MSVYFLETSGIPGLIMSESVVTGQEAGCVNAKRPARRHFLSALTAAIVLCVSASVGLAAGSLPGTSVEQTMNRVATKTCRLNKPCKRTAIPDAESLESTPSPEQIVNRIEQATAPLAADKPETMAAPDAAVIAQTEPVGDTAAAAEASSELTDSETGPLVISAVKSSRPKVTAAPVSEQSMNQKQPADVYGQGTPFSISVDGETIVGRAAADKDIRADAGLAAADIQVKYDGLDVTPLLNASHSEDAGTVRFQGHLNYPDYVEKGEIRIYAMKDGKVGDIVATVPADKNFRAVWARTDGGDSHTAYVLRVYDTKGRFDETELIALDGPTAGALGGVVSGGNFDKDRSALRNIPVHGGSVTVFGRNVPAGYGVKVLGEEIRTDANNSFVTQKILPPGDHDVDVAVYGVKDEGLSFTRQVNIPDNDWFYVGLADFTLGHKFKGRLENTNAGEYKSTYTKGRMAFYLKGKIKGKYLLTAAADTGEGELKDMFTGWDAKDPRRFLKALDPDDYYPVYGDDSSLVEDAPTKGKFYVRLARGASHVMWGNFKTKITGTKFAAAERALYGAGAHLQSEGATSFGEAKTGIDLYAAQPGTTPQRDNFRGTGGSAYFLKRQIITPGSEQVTVDVRDPLTGRVLSTRSLKAGDDYEIDYVQGVIILKAPLSSSTGAVAAVQSGTNGNNTQHLIVNYEYSPRFGADSGQVYGGRASQWLGDHVQVGASASKDTSGSANNELLEADIRLRATEKTYIEAEVAQSRGKGLGQSFSTDGGLSFIDETAQGSKANRAVAYRVKAVADLGEVFAGRFNGQAEAFYEQRGAGFSALDGESALNKRIYGGSLKLDVTEDLSVHMALKAVEENDPLGLVQDKNLFEAVIEADAQITENLSLLAGVNWTDYRDPTLNAHRNGTRTDIGARLTYDVSENTSVFVFGQTTAHLKGDRLRNDRIGVGAETKLTDKLTITGSVSTGTTGIGGDARVTYESAPDNRTFVGYKLDPDRDELSTGGQVIDGRDKGVVVAGSYRKLNDWLSAFAESDADFFGRKRSLTHVYGITFKPDAIWSASLGMELGTILDDRNVDFDRRGFSAKAGYLTEGFSASAALEARFEDSSDNKRDRNTYLMRAQTSWKTNENWRLSAHVDALISRSDQATVLDGDYVEASLGYAYRPVSNDRLNVLLKYAFLYDLPGPDQVSVNNQIPGAGPAQRSHVFSVDASYDINEHLTIGAKYGFRFGDVSTTRQADDFTRSTAHLGIIRADINFIRSWDAVLEARVLYAPEARQTDFGALAAVYRHLGNNAKIGVGYNFGRFSDDLTDLTHDDQGVFLNVIGKF